jgi:hypothetical protein
LESTVLRICRKTEKLQNVGNENPIETHETNKFKSGNSSMIVSKEHTYIVFFFVSACWYQLE